MNPMLQSVSDQACQDLADQFRDAEEELLQAIHKATREAQLQETPLKFNIGFKVALDLEKSVMTNTLSWSVKHSLETSHQIEDPMQMKLPVGEGVTMKLKTGDKEVTLTPEKIRDAAKRLKKAAEEHGQFGSSN